jgi:hypothetical protein
MADRRTLSRAVKRNELSVREADISRRSTEESFFASYYPYFEAADSETKTPSRRPGFRAIQLKEAWGDLIMVSDSPSAKSL